MHFLDEVSRNEVWALNGELNQPLGGLESVCDGVSRCVYQVRREGDTMCENSGGGSAEMIQN